MDKTKEHTIEIPEWQSLPISILKDWVSEAEKRGDNAVMFGVEYGYYDSIDGCCLRSKKGRYKTIISIIILALAILMIVIWLCIESKDWGFLLFAGIVWALMSFALNFTWHDGYKNGQIDILTGHKPLYELKTNPDSTKEWEQIK